MTTTTEPTIHTQFELDMPTATGPTRVAVDEGLYLLLSHVWRRGLATRASCEGSGPTPLTQLPYIIFPGLDDAFEFLKHTAVMTDYRYGEGVGLNIIHPMEDIHGPPEGKVTWAPSLNLAIINAWGES
jgi:hypothetical protein